MEQKDTTGSDGHCFETSKSRGRGENNNSDGRLMVAITLFLMMMMVITVMMMMMRDSPTSAADPMVETEGETTFFLPERLLSVISPCRENCGLI